MAELTRAAMWARRDLTRRAELLAERVAWSRVVVDNAPRWASRPNAEPCWWCRLQPADGVDHLVPRCQGGTDDPTNLVPACSGCNSRKGGRTPEEFGELLRRNAGVLGTACPRCLAEPGVPCPDKSGFPRLPVASSQHEERRFAYYKLVGG